jgi:hypothetical protein
MLSTHKKTVPEPVPVKQKQKQNVAQVAQVAQLTRGQNALHTQKTCARTCANQERRDTLGLLFFFQPVPPVPLFLLP